MSELHLRKPKSTEEKQTFNLGDDYEECNDADNNTELKQRRNKTEELNGRKKFEKISIITVTILSFLTRFYKLHFPGAVLFDEVHFVSMAQWYVKRTYFFDIHPPLAKLCLAAIVYITGFHLNEPYRDIGKVYLHDGYIAMRMWQAFHGAVLPIIAFYTMRELKASVTSSLLVGLLLVFELSFQTISRAVLLDSFLYSSIAFGFYCALRMWKEDQFLWNSTILKAKKNQNNKNQDNDDKKKNMSSYYYNHATDNGDGDGGNHLLKFWIWTILCGLSMGSAFSIKHTGLSVVGYVGVIHLYKAFRRFLDSIDLLNQSPPNNKSELSVIPWRIIGSGITLILFVVFIYFISFALHFALLTHTGIDEDSMNDNFRSQLIGSHIKLPEGETPQGLLTNIIQLNERMLEINSASIFEHYHSSSWYEWPILYKGIVYFWENLPDSPYHICVYLFGNPIIYWTALLAFIISLFYVDRNFQFYFSEYSLTQTQIDNLKPIAICVFAYLSNMLPYVLIKRTCYLYHYHPSLYFAIMLIGLMLDKISNRKIRNYIIALLLLVVIIVYIYYLPFSYALPLTEDEHDARRWFKSIFPYW